MSKAIDVWCNPFTPEYTRRMFMEVDELRAVVEWWHMHERVKGLSVPDFVKMMDEVGVDKVLVPSIKMGSYQKRATILEFSDEEIYELTKQAPGRVYGLAGINPIERMDGVRKLEKAVKEYGFAGAHLHIYGFDLPINHRDLYPFYAKCEELGVPIVMQIGHSAEFMPSAHARPGLLDDIALYFPKLKIVGAHTGWPWIEEAIAMAWKHPNVYLATTAHAPAYWDPAIVKFMNTRGRGKVMYGTDYPVLTHPETIPAIDKIDLKPAAKEALLFGAAASIFKF